MKREVIFVGGAARTGTTLCQSLVCGMAGTGPQLPESAQILFLQNFVSKIEIHNQRFNGAFWPPVKEARLFGRFLEVLIGALRHPHVDCCLVLKSPAATPLFPRIADHMGDKALFVIMVRDPRDTIASMVAWGRRAAETGKHLWFSGRDIPQLCRYFLSFYGSVLARPELFTAHHFVRYEDLVIQPTNALHDFRMMFDPVDGASRAELQPNWGQLDLTADGPVGASASPLYGKSVSTARIGGHTNVLTMDEVRQIETLCGDFMERFAYDRPVPQTGTAPPISLDSLTDVTAPVQPIVRSDNKEARDAVAAEMGNLQDRLAHLNKKIQSLTGTLNNIVSQRDTLRALNISMRERETKALACIHKQRATIAELKDREGRSGNDTLA